MKLALSMIGATPRLRARRRPLPPIAWFTAGAFSAVAILAFLGAL